jgi:hypothetical protein
MTREQWMNDFALAAAPLFDAAGFPIPKVRMSCGFTSHGARGKAIGQCFNDTMSDDAHFEIFIVPSEADTSRVADILTHELIHAAVGLEEGHKGNFRKLATALGLTGKMTATVAGDAWREWAHPIIAEIGDLPHATLNSSSLSSGPKKQATRMLKCECNDCGFTFRASAVWALDTSPVLRCPDPSCGGHVVANA